MGTTRRSRLIFSNTERRKHKRRRPFKWGRFEKGAKQLTDQKPAALNLEEARRAHDRSDIFYNQVNEAAIKTGESTFQACLLINGGAARGRPRRPILA
jgi:hypothetical protein